MQEISRFSCMLFLSVRKTLQHIADREVRRISQIREILLTIGTETYGKEGSKYLVRYLGHRKESRQP